MTKVPRVVIAGTNSGCGKTSITCAILRAMHDSYDAPVPCALKCGPDYIDPMFHSEVTGVKSANLDSFFFDDETLKYLLAQNSQNCGIAVIEGVMGFYDGMGFNGTAGSCHEISRITKSPVILVIDAKGMSQSLLAVTDGFLNLHKPNNICGLILNRCGTNSYRSFKSMIESRYRGRILPLGHMPELKGAEIKSRHLGLVTAAEIEDLNARLDLLAENAKKYIDIDRIINIADAAPDLDINPKFTFPRLKAENGFKDGCCRIAVASDRAFCFYYYDSLDALANLGAELVFFSPLDDEKLPDDTDGLYLGGGYPELYASELSKNEKMRTAVREAVRGGMPCIAECGGFMYLTDSIDGFPMAGAIEGKSKKKSLLTRFGYLRLCADKDNMLCKKGEGIAAHEFHYYDSDNSGGDFTALKANRKNYKAAFAGGSLYAGYPHFHFYSNPDFAVNFVRACAAYRNNRK